MIPQCEYPFHILLIHSRLSYSKRLQKLCIEVVQICYYTKFICDFNGILLCHVILIIGYNYLIKVDVLEMKMKVPQIISHYWFISNDEAYLSREVGI